MEKVEPMKTRKEIREMKEALEYYGGTHGARDEFLFTLGINTGLRVSDLLQLKKKNIKDYRLKLTERKTRKYNNILLTNISGEIDEYTKNLEDEDYLFASRKGNAPITRTQAYRIIRRSANAIGLKSIGSHSMRKTFGYHFYKETKDIAFLMTLFNHSSQSTTLMYIGLNQEEKDRAFAELFKGL